VPRVVTSIVVNFVQTSTNAPVHRAKTAELVLTRSTATIVRATMDSPATTVR